MKTISILSARDSDEDNCKKITMSTVELTENEKKRIGQYRD